MQSHKTEIPPSSHPPQSTDKYEPEPANQLVVAQNIHSAPSNQMGPSYIVNHQIDPNHSVPHLPLTNPGPLRSLGLNQPVNGPIFSQAAPQQRFQGYNMSGMG